MEKEFVLNGNTKQNRQQPHGSEVREAVVVSGHDRKRFFNHARKWETDFSATMRAGRSSPEE